MLVFFNILLIIVNLLNFSNEHEAQILWHKSTTTYTPVVQIVVQMPVANIELQTFEEIVVLHDVESIEHIVA